jgi:hypothetical protein
LLRLQPKLTGAKIESDACIRGQSGSGQLFALVIAQRLPYTRGCWHLLAFTDEETPMDTALRILIAEDHEDTATSLGMLLRLHGYEVEIAVRRFQEVLHSSATVDRDPAHSAGF